MDHYCARILFFLQIFYTCSHPGGAIILSLISPLVNVQVNINMIHFRPLYSHVCLKAFANRNSVWPHASFCLFYFQSENIAHHWYRSIQQEHHPSLRQVQTHDKGVMWNNRQASIRL